MEPSNQQAGSFSYRHYGYKLSPTPKNNMVVKVYGTVESKVVTLVEYSFPVQKGIFSAFSSITTREAEKAVRKAHARARNYIDERLTVLDAIEGVNPDACR